MAEEAEDAVTEDAFLGGRLRIRQFARGFRAGLDGVLLAACCPAKKGDTVLDAGCGSGVGMLCVAAREPGAILTGIEIDRETAALAEANIAANGFLSACNVISGDLTGSWTDLEALGLRREFYDHAIANPPYYITGQSREPGNERKRLARLAGPAALDDWAKFLAGAVKPGGMATFIHAADSLPNLLSAMQGRFGALTVVPVYAKARASAMRIIIQGKKGSRAPVRISPPIVLHENDGRPTPAATAILRDGAALPIS